MNNKSSNKKSGLFRTLAKLTSSSAAVAPPNLKTGFTSAASTSEGIAQTQDFFNQLDELLENE